MALDKAGLETRPYYASGVFKLEPLKLLQCIANTGSHSHSLATSAYCAVVFDEHETAIIVSVQHCIFVGRRADMSTMLVTNVSLLVRVCQCLYRDRYRMARTFVLPGRLMYLRPLKNKPHVKKQSRRYDAFWAKPEVTCRVAPPPHPPPPPRTARGCAYWGRL